MAEWRELGSTRFAYDTKRYYELKVENRGSLIRAYIDGGKILEAEDPGLLQGKAGITANIPARFQDFRITCAGAAKREIDRHIRSREEELQALRAQNPKPKLWKRSL